MDTMTAVLFIVIVALLILVAVLAIGRKLDGTSQLKELFKLGQEEIDKIIRPLQEKIELLDRDGVANAASFKEQIATMINQSDQLGKETRELKETLSKPKGRGDWGEIQLQKMLELSGLCKGIEYEMQKKLTPNGQDNGENGNTPDAIVHLPENRSIILDSKIPMKNLKDASKADTEKQKSKAYATLVKTHIRKLSGKKYQELLDNTPEYTVMVLPEYALLYAIEGDDNLIELAFKDDIIIVSPSTLLALLKALALTWKQIRLEKNAKDIADTSKVLYKRLADFIEHHISMGELLDKTVASYNKATGSWNDRVMSQVTKLKKLGVSSSKEPKPLIDIEKTTAKITKKPEPTPESE